jgi:hypothetical protein
LWPAGLHVDVRRPIDGRIIFFGNQEFACLTIERVCEAVTIEVDEQVAHFPADLLVGENHFVDAVVVPFVMGCHLVGPLGHAGVGIAGEDGHRPAVVARPLLRVPGARVARAVIEEIELGIPGVPPPGRTAADLPLIALPGTQARVLADRLAEVCGLFGIHEHFGIRPCRVGAPDLFPGLEVIGGKGAPDAELAA